MMNQQTLDRLHSLRWLGLAEAWRQQMEMPEVASLSFDERFSLLLIKVLKGPFDSVGGVYQD